jgi:signal transduction histidine kinase
MPSYIPNFIKRLINADRQRIQIRFKGYELMANKKPDTQPVANPGNEVVSWQPAAEKLKELNSVVRHDVLNQLTILIGFLQYSEDMIEDPKIREFVRKEETAGINIQKLMEFTRGYQDMVIHPPCWLRLSEKPREALYPITFENVKIENRLPDIEIFASPLIERVLFIIADNAVQFGRDTKRISISSSENDDGSLTLIMEDDGGGIPEEERAMLFERGHGQNRGYGLWLSKEILSLTGITIAESGVEGKGARFEMTVPAGCWRTA